VSSSDRCNRKIHGAWSREEKEQLVAACLEPDAVISEIARAAGIHVSQLFRWRKELCQVDGP